MNSPFSIDDCPVLRANRPVVLDDEYDFWSHPFARFSYEDNRIRVKFLADPSYPACKRRLYPRDSWMQTSFLLASKPEKDSHLHSIDDLKRRPSGVSEFSRIFDTYNYLDTKLTGEKSEKDTVMLQEFLQRRIRKNWV